MYSRWYWVIDQSNSKGKLSAEGKGQFGNRLYDSLVFEDIDLSIDFFDDLNSQIGIIWLNCFLFFPVSPDDEVDLFGWRLLLDWKEADEDGVGVGSGVIPAEVCLLRGKEQSFAVEYNYFISVGAVPNHEGNFSFWQFSKMNEEGLFDFLSFKPAKPNVFALESIP